MTIGKIFIQIGCSWFPKNFIMALEDLILYPIELPIYLFGTFLCMVLFSIPSAVEIYLCMGFACCGCTIYSRTTLICSTAFVLWKNDPTYASNSNDITFFMILESGRISPLDFLVLLKFCIRKKKFPPERFLACNYDRYDASLCMCNVIFLEWNINLAYEFLAQ